MNNPHIYKPTIFILVTLITICLYAIFVGSLSDTPESIVSTEISSESTICTETSSEVAETLPTPNYTEDELFCLAAAIYNEAGGDDCLDNTRRLVGYVILNRVNDSRFPNTIRKVLEARGQYGRFYYTGVEFVNRGSSKAEKQAIERAYQIAAEVLKKRDNVPIPHNVLYQAEFVQGDLIYTYQDGIYFCSIKEVN